MVVIDVDMLQNNDELNLQINSCIENMQSKKASFQYEFCDSVCLSRGCLKRHGTKKRPFSKTQEASSSDCLGSDLVDAAEIKLEPQIFKSFFEKSL